MHLTYTCFLWCASDLGDEQVQFDDAAEPVYAQPECPSDGVEEQTEA